MKSILLIAALLLAPPALAQEFSLRGYLLDLAGWNSESLTAGSSGMGGVQNTLHNRLTLRYYPSPSWVAGADLRTRLITQRGFNQDGSFASTLENPGDLADLTALLVNRADIVLASQFDRLFVDWTGGPLQVIVGRQRIAWGTNLVWNPTDVFNPYSVLDFDYEERPGIDAFRAQYFTGPTSKIEIAVAPGETANRRTAIGLLHWNHWDYDFNILGGVFQEGHLLGFSWAGQILQGGFRGEVRYVGHQHVTDPLTREDIRQSFLTAGVSADYTFPSSLYLHTEVLYSGSGATKNAGLRWAAALAEGDLSPARWSLYQEIAADLSPLVRGSVFVLFNPEDGSFISVPSVSWSVATNWDFLGIALLSHGGESSEYGSSGSSIFARLKWTFL